MVGRERCLFCNACDGTQLEQYCGIASPVAIDKKAGNSRKKTNRCVRFRNSASAVVFRNTPQAGSFLPSGFSRSIIPNVMNVLCLFAICCHDCHIGWVCIFRVGRRPRRRFVIASGCPQRSPACDGVRGLRDSNVRSSVTSDERYRLEHRLLAGGRRARLRPDISPSLPPCLSLSPLSLRLLHLPAVLLFPSSLPRFD